MDLQRIGAFLAQLRRQKGLTQEQLGEQLGVTNKTVSRWETGRYLPPVEMLKALSEMYGISINEVLSGERLGEEAFREKAEENIRSALNGSSFTLEEKIDYYKRKWKKDHCWTCFWARVLIWLLLAIGIMTHEPGWTIAYVIANLFYYCVERNQMMIYVEERAFDGSGKQ